MIACRGQIAPKLPQEHRCFARAKQGAPVLVPNGWQIIGIARVAKILLCIDARGIVVRRVHQPVRGIESHRKGSSIGEIAAPPVASRSSDLNALDDDEEIRICRQHGVAASLGSQSPIVGCAIAPRCGTVRFIVQIDADQR